MILLLDHCISYYTSRGIQFYTSCFIFSMSYLYQKVCHLTWKIVEEAILSSRKRLKLAQDFWLDCRDAARANPHDAAAQRMVEQAHKDVKYARGVLHRLELEWGVVREVPTSASSITVASSEATAGD